MKRFLILLSIVLIWTCSSSSSKPTEPTVPTQPPTVNNLTPAPQPPTVNNLSITTNEDTPTTFTMTGTDPEGAALTFSISTQPQNGTVTASGAAGTYTPNENFNGTDTFAYIASDGALSSTAGLVSVTVTAVDDDPNTMNVSAVTDEDNAVEITLEAEEYDGDTISFNIKDNPTSGSVTLTGDKATYTPNANYYGADSFTFEAVDYTAKKILNTATASITINPINDAPTIETQSVEGMQYSNLSISLGGNDVDGDNLSYIIDEDVNNGTTTISGSTLEFVPNPIWHGQDSLSVKLYDGALYSDAVKIYIDYDYFFQASPINYNDTSMNLKHSMLWLDTYQIPYDNGLPVNGSIEGDPNFPYWYDAAYIIADFNGDGYEDLLHSKTGSDLETAEYPLELFLNDQTNQNFILDNTLIPDNAKNTTARQAMVGDFNNDGKPDVAYCANGIHSQGRPGEIPSILLSSDNGYIFFRLENILAKGWWAHGASGDIDNDGIIEIMMTGAMPTQIFEFNGTDFSLDNIIVDQVPIEFTPFIYDINKDGLLDLIGSSTLDFSPFSDGYGSNNHPPHVAVYLNSESGFSTDNILKIGTGKIEGVNVADLVIKDINNDGIEEVIGVLNNEVIPGDSDEEIIIFTHDGNYNYTDITDQIVDNPVNGTDRSMVWIRVQDIDGDGNVDIFNADKGNSKFGSVQHWEWDGSKMRRK